LPAELTAYANLPRFARVEQAAQEQQLVQQLEAWLFPPKPAHLDLPRAALRVVCRAEPDRQQPRMFSGLAVRFYLLRPRAGEKAKTLGEILELTTRAAHEQEQFPPADWEFIRWLAEASPKSKVPGPRPKVQSPESRVQSAQSEVGGPRTAGGGEEGDELLVLSEWELLQWLARW